MNQERFFQPGKTQKYNFNLLCKRITFYGLLFVFKVLGLSPCRVNQLKILTGRHNNNEANLFEVSKYGHLYNFLLIIVLSTYCILTLSLKLWSLDYVKSELADKIDECLMLYGTLVLVVVWLNYILQQKKIVNIINGLHSINNNLENCDKYFFKSDCRLYIVSISNFFLCFGIFVTELLITGACSVVLWITPFITSSWVLIQYTLLLNVIFQLFESINTKILALGEINIENYHQSMFCSKVLLRESAIKDIHCINYAILQLCDICNQLADFYAIPTLMITVYFVTSTIFNSYFIILSLITSTDKDLLKLFLDFGHWSLTVFFNFIALTSNVFRTTREFKKTPQYISLVSNRCAMNSTTKQALLNFLRDVSLRNVIFTTYGVITLDGSLLQTIFGTMVTYLIILIQFRSQ